MAIIQPYASEITLQVYLVANLFLFTTSSGTAFISNSDSSKAFITQSCQLSKVFGYSTGGEQVKSKKEQTYSVSTNFN